SHDGKLYVVGGGYLNRDDLSKKLFIYDHTSNKWTEGANMPTARVALTAIFINGSLSSLCGVDKSETFTIMLDYDLMIITWSDNEPDTNKWTSQEPMPTARH